MSLNKNKKYIIPTLYRTLSEQHWNYAENKMWCNGELFTTAGIFYKNGVKDWEYFLTRNNKGRKAFRHSVQKKGNIHIVIPITLPLPKSKDEWRHKLRELVSLFNSS